MTTDARKHLDVARCAADYDIDIADLGEDARRILTDTAGVIEVCERVMSLREEP